MLSPKVPAEGTRSRFQAAQSGVPLLLAVMMVLIPATGVPSEVVLQDTLKSALVAVFVLAAALLFFWQMRGRQRPVYWHGIVAIPLALTAYAAASMAWAHTYLAAVETIRWLLLALIVWLGSQCLHTPAARRTIACGIHGGAVVASVWACLQFWVGLDLFPQAAAPASTFVNRNFYAEYAVSALPFSVWVLAGSRSRRVIYSLAFLLAIQVLAILMTGTRSALLALLFVMPIAIFLLARYRRQLPCSDWPAAGKRWALIIFLGTVLGLGNLPGNNPSIAVEGKHFTPIERGIVRAGSVLKTSEYLTGSFSLRTDMWKASARMIEANPWTGVGAGSWEVQVPRYQHRDTSSELDFYAHNEAIQLLAEYGLIVGGLSLAFLLAYLLLSAQTNLTLSVDQRAEGPVRVAALCSLLALLLVSNAGFPLHLAATGALLALCLALLAGSDIRLDRPGAVKSSTFSTLVAGWSLAGCAMGLMAAIAISVQAIQAEQALISTTKLMLQSLRAQQSEGKPAKPEAAAVLVASAREAMSLNPHYRKLLNNLGSLLAVQGQWGPAIEVWETIARSRPHIADIWANLVQGHSQLGNRQAASAALARLNELQPTSLRTRRLEILLMSRGGQESAAAEKLREHYRTGNFDLNLVQAGYSLGMEMKNPALAREALALQVRMWPGVDPAVHQKMEALQQAQ